MPKVHQVKSARKDYPASGINKGDSYYKWSIKTGPATGIIHRSKTYPKPSQLTGSPFMSQFFAIQEEIEIMEASNFGTVEDLASSLDEIIGNIESLMEETQSSLDNMPEGLQQGHVGEMLQQRIDGLSDWMADLQGVDLNFFYDEEEPDGDAEEVKAWQERKNESEQEFIDQAIAEIQSMEASVE